MHFKQQDTRFITERDNRIIVVSTPSLMLLLRAGDPTALTSNTTFTHNTFEERDHEDDAWYVCE